MRHSAVITFSDIPKAETSKKVYIDMIEWTMMVCTIDDKICIYVGPTLHKALVPYHFEADVSVLNEKGNAYKDSTFTVKCTRDRETIEKGLTLLGRRGWKSVHLIKKQEDGSVKIRLRVKSLTSESSFSLAVLNAFLMGNAHQWPTQAHKELERHLKEIGDWERMMQETLIEKETIKAERDSLQALLDETVVVANQDDKCTLPSHEPHEPGERGPVCGDP